ncbi:MAG: peptidyl-prolyl cis-trans isomerase A (cyclophilin A) [Polaribacter sp.]|jgi:peptidyl-prolyl cis-trans isomerase A (cyclophilin A)
MTGFVKILFYFCLLTTVCQLVAKEVDTQRGELIQPDDLFPRVQFDTTAGKIIVELDRLRAPITSNNFIYYVTNGSYDGTIFHRVVKAFVVQGGGYDEQFTERKSESSIYNESGNGLKNEMFTIAMAREHDPHSAMRQFYFNMADNDNLDPGRAWGYTVFGTVTEGEDALELIANTKVHRHEQLDWENVPIKAIFLKKATLLKPQL